MDRTTSAGYRLPLARPRSSEFHQRCIPEQSRPAADHAKVSEAEVRKCDVVRQDEVWKQAVSSETRRTKQWSEEWGFLTEYDTKGNPIEKEEPKEETKPFSENIPNTNAGNYGSRLNTELGQTMQQLEFQFHSSQRRKKLDNEMICY